VLLLSVNESEQSFPKYYAYHSLQKDFGGTWHNVGLTDFCIIKY